MAAETGFIIDGIRHEVPTIDTFNMDEAQVMYDYCGLTIEDFLPFAIKEAKDDEATDEEDDEALAELAKNLKNPGFLRALMHVAYQRANPEMSASKVKAAIKSADHTSNWTGYLADVMEKTEAQAQEDASQLPPASPTEPEKSSSESSVVSPTSPEKSGEPTGSSSSNGSDAPDAQLTRIGTSGSATSSISRRISLAE